MIHFSLCLGHVSSSFQRAKDKNRISVLLNSLNQNEDFEGIGQLHSHPWTDEEISSIFRIKTSSDEVREHITAVLRRIHCEEIATFNNEFSKMQIFMNDLTRKARRILDSTVWDDDHLAMLREALYATRKETLLAKMRPQIVRNELPEKPLTEPPSSRSRYRRYRLSTRRQHSTREVDPVAQATEEIVSK